MTSFRRPFSRSPRRLGALQLPLCGPARTSSTRHLPRWVSKSSSPTWNRTTLWCLAQKKPGSANCHTRKWETWWNFSKWWTQFVRKAHVWSQTCEFSIFFSCLTSKKVLHRMERGHSEIRSYFTSWLCVAKCYQRVQLFTGWWFGLPFFSFSHEYWVAFIIPIDEIIFFRGVGIHGWTLRTPPVNA